MRLKPRWRRRLLAGLSVLLLPLLALAEDGLADARDLLARNRPGDALALIDRYLLTHPGDADAQLARGGALSRLGRHADAIAAYTALGQMQPALAEPYRRLGALYWQVGDGARARAALEQALARDPADAGAQTLLGDIELSLAGAAYQRAQTLAPADATLRAKQRGVAALLAGHYPDTDIVVEPGLALPIPLDATGGGEVAAEGAPTAEMLRLVRGWLTAWSSKDIRGYLGYYAETFQPETEASRAVWAQGRRDTLEAQPPLQLSASALRATLLDAEHARLRFQQHYDTPGYSGVSMKTLELVNHGDGWLIERERSEPD